MSCYHPITGYVVGKTDSGARKIKFSEQLSPRDLILESLSIPCGQCIGCRLQYSRVWADRCMMELQYHDSAYFVTLTYDDEHVPKHEYGDGKYSLSLEPKDLTQFMKNLRNWYIKDKIRFFACGEYGDKTKRPHYHAIIYGLHLDDLKYYKTSNLKDIYYNSESLNGIWKKGHVVIADVTWETCAYVARYVVKKLKGQKAEDYKIFNMEPEFVRMSRGGRTKDPDDNKRGIGYQYFVDHPEMFDFNEVYLNNKNGSIACVPGRYFKKKLEQSNPEKFEELRKHNIEIGNIRIASKLSLTDLEESEMLEVEENSKILRSKALKREL